MRILSIRHLPFCIIIATIILSISFHWNIFNKDICGIHTWRQSQTQLNTRYFYREDANILNTRVAHFNGGKDNLYRYEFPVMQWTIAMLEKVFGENIAVTRITVFIIGLSTLLAFFLLTQALFQNYLVSALSVWAFNFSPVFFYYTVNPLPDNLALCAGMFYLYFALKNYYKETLINHIAAAFFLLIACLSKLPFVVFGIVSFIYFFQSCYADRFKIKASLILRLSLYPIFLLPAFFWYRWVMPGWEGNGILHGIFANDNSWSNIIRILDYHLWVMFPKILMNPVSIILILVAILFFVLNKDIFKKKSIALLAAIFMVIVYFVLEINMIDVVHDYYMMPFLPFIYIILSYATKKLYNRSVYTRWALMPIFLIMPYQNHLQNKDSWTVEKSGSNSNLFLHQDKLKNAVPKGERVIVLNDVSQFVFFYKLDKEGYVFNNDYLPVEWVDDLVRNHAVKYMYSDSRKVDESDEMRKRIEKVIMQVGNLKVIKLKSILKQ
jgi:4-amino-4-deoxy-L-arabinose transferase-like glycosyltransferase